MTDVVGYRNDSAVNGGALMSALAPQLDNCMTGKLPLLNGPGMTIENSLYYDIASSTVTAVELQETFQKDRIVLNNLSTGNSGTCYIPNVLFTNTLFLCLELKSLTWPTTMDNFPNNSSYIYLPECWGFQFLGSLIIYPGACTVANIEISGESNFLVAMAQCETKGKRQLMMSRAGRYLNSMDPTSVLAPPAPGQPVFRLRPKYQLNSPYCYSSVLNTFNASSPLQPYDAEYPPLRTAIFPLRTFFSSIYALEKRISFDTKLLTQPIQITCQMRPLNQVCITNVSSFQTTLQQFQSATVQSWQEELSDKSLSLRSELLRAPDFNVSYPFQYIQSAQFQIPTASGAPSPWDGSNLINMNLTSLLNSDLTTMLFYVTGDYQRGSKNASTSACVGGATSIDGTNFITTYNGADYTWCYGVELQNMELKLNGQRYYAFQADTYSGVTMAKHMDNEVYFVKRPLIGQYRQQVKNNDIFAFNQFYLSDATSGAPGVVPVPEMRSALLPSHMYELDFGKMRSLVNEAHMQNTCRFTNQIFQLSFVCADLFACPNLAGFATGGFSNPSISISPWVLYMTFCYNAVLLVGGDGGTSKLITN